MTVGGCAVDSRLQRPGEQETTEGNREGFELSERVKRFSSTWHSNRCSGFQFIRANSRPLVVNPLQYLNREHETGQSLNLTTIVILDFFCAFCTSWRRTRNERRNKIIASGVSGCLHSMPNKESSRK